MALLQDVAEIFNGKTPSKSEQRNSGFPVLKIKDVSENGDFRGAISSFVDDEMAKRFEKKIVQSEDIMLLNAAHNSEYVGSKNCIATEQMAGALATGEWTVIRPDKTKIIPRYLYFCINSSHIKQEIRNIVKGIHLYPKDLKKIRFLLPPLLDQKRIVRILDQADALRRKRREVIKLLDEYVQSVFLEMFGDPVTNPNKWSVLSVKDVVSDITAGTSYSGEQKKILENDEMGVLKISAVTWGKFDPQEFKAVKKKLLKKKIVTLKKGDLLFSRANTRELVAATSIVDRDYPKLFLPDKLWRIDLNKSLCDKYYFDFLLRSQGIKESLTKTATGTSGSMLNISMQKLKTLLVPIPPIDIQRNFAKKIENVTKLEMCMNSQIDELDNQFNALIQRAFAGAL